MAAHPFAIEGAQIHDSLESEMDEDDAGLDHTDGPAANLRASAERMMGHLEVGRACWGHRRMQLYRLID